MEPILVNLKKAISVLGFCLNHKETPLIAKILVLLLLAYIVSPVDLIPDFIPIFGLMDEMIIIPIGMYVIYRLIPEELIKQSEDTNKKIEKWLVVLGLFIVITIWVITIVCIWYLIK